MKSEYTKVIIGDRQIDIEVYHTFKKGNENYMVYTDFVKDQNNEDRILASKFSVEKDKTYIYDDLTEGEYDMVDKEIERFINER